ncbi:hypothetical protein ACFQ5M_08195 [Agrilactobacillus yilanensis]|uniref:TerB family tellurite resistance protein n=1 Tax=Agrilactobacillus yilanensis TaxID=2485997 RepID=A0ABW4J821_9LACO|nr:hypothetical protein [Agrilactobacillus yilanensis]
MFNWFRKKNPATTQSSAPPVEKTDSVVKQEGLPITDDEKRLVTLICTAIAAGDAPESSFTVKKVTKLKDRVGLPMTFEEKERVTAIASAILAGDQPESHFSVKSITKIK